MTAVDTAIPTSKPLGFFEIGLKVLRMTFPLTLGSLTVAAQAIIKVEFLTYSNDGVALYTMSMVQPGFILMLAFLEALTVANQVFSSRSYKVWPKGDIRRSTRLLSLIGSILVGLVALAIYAARKLVSPDSSAFPILPNMALFVLSFLPFLLFELRNAALRGQGRTTLALLPLAMLVIVDLAVTGVGVMHFNLGFNAVLLGNVAGPLAALPLTSYLLRHEIGQAVPSTDGSFKENIVRMLFGVAAPTFLTTFAGSIAAMVIFPMLAGFGADVVSSFLLIIRIRVLFIIPAISAGSAIAIMINKRSDDEHGRESKRILIYGTALVALIYAVATTALYLGHEWIVDLVVPGNNPSLHVATSALFVLLILTFFLLAVATMLQVVLEHLGRGALVLVTTLLTEAFTISGALLLLNQGQGLPALTMIMTATATISLLAYSLFFLRLAKNLGARHAV
jgi:Na+-driven multidrug efflux pump